MRSLALALLALVFAVLPGSLVAKANSRVFDYVIKINYDDPHDARLLRSDGSLIKRYTVALPARGALPPKWKTPRIAQVSHVLVNATWVPTPRMQARRRAQNKKRLKPIPPGPRSPIGKYFIVLRCLNHLCNPYVALHGNGGWKCRNESCIGKYVSSGCIRMYNKDAASLAKFVTKVMREGKRIKVIFGYFGKRSRRKMVGGTT